jgi:hypothetical protein
MSEYRITWLMSIGPAQMDVDESKVLEHVSSLNKLPGVVNVEVQILDQSADN